MSLPESFFVSTNLHARPVELQDGTKHVIHFRELPALEFRRWRDAEQSDDAEVRSAGLPRLLSLGVANPDGSTAMTEKQARALKGAPAKALLEALLEVNAPGKPAAASQGEANSGSGTSSP